MAKTFFCAQFSPEQVKALNWGTAEEREFALNTAYEAEQKFEAELGSLSISQRCRAMATAAELNILLGRKCK